MTVGKTSAWCGLFDPLFLPFEGDSIPNQFRISPSKRDAPWGLAPQHDLHFWWLILLSQPPMFIAFPNLYLHTPWKASFLFLTFGSAFTYSLASNRVRYGWNLKVGTAQFASKVLLLKHSTPGIFCLHCLDCFECHISLSLAMPTCTLHAIAKVVANCHRLPNSHFTKVSSVLGCCWNEERGTRAGAWTFTDVGCHVSQHTSVERNGRLVFQNIFYPSPYFCFSFQSLATPVSIVNAMKTALTSARSLNPELQVGTHTVTHFFCRLIARSSIFLV